MSLDALLEWLLIEHLKSVGMWPPEEGKAGPESKNKARKK
jgi:hypothetical protein